MSTAVVPLYIYDRLITKINYDSIIAGQSRKYALAMICDNSLLKATHKYLNFEIIFVKTDQKMNCNLVLFIRKIMK